MEKLNTEELGKDSKEFENKFLESNRCAKKAHLLGTGFIDKTQTRSIRKTKDPYEYLGGQVMDM